MKSFAWNAKPASRSTSAPPSPKRKWSPVAASTGHPARVPDGRAELRPAGQPAQALSRLPFRRHWPTIPMRRNALLAAMTAEKGNTLDVLLDLDVGQHRTGIAPGPEAAKLYELTREATRLCGRRASTSTTATTIRRAWPNAGGGRGRCLNPCLRLRANWRKGAAGAALGRGRHADVSRCSPAWICPAWSVAGNLRVARSRLRLPNSAKWGFTPAALLLTRVISKPIATPADARPRLQGGGQRSAAGKTLLAAQCAGLSRRAAKRGAPGHRDAGRRPASRRRRGLRACRITFVRRRPSIALPTR